MHCGSETHVILASVQEVLDMLILIFLQNPLLYLLSWECMIIGFLLHLAPILLILNLTLLNKEIIEKLVLEMEVQGII